MDRIVVKDWEFDPSECKFEPGTIEIKPEVQELMNNGLDVKHYLSRHLRGDCGYIDSGEHALYAETVEKIAKGERVDKWEDPISEYDITPEKTLGIITYSDEPTTIINLLDRRPENLEELYIKVMTFLNQLPPKDKEELIRSAGQKIPAG